MMKILYGFIFFLIIVLVPPVHAQKAYVGVLGGSHFADLDIVFKDEPPVSYDIKSKTLFGVGGYIGLSLNKYLSVQIEPMFLKKGGLFTQPPGPEISIRSSQIELPIILKAGIGENIRPYILGGVFASFILDATIETEINGLLLKGDLTKILEDTEYGILFGAGVRFPAWIGAAFIEGRYSLGLSNINIGGYMNLTYNNVVVDGFQTDRQDNIKTMGFQLMIGYQLPIEF